MTKDLTYVCKYLKALVIPHTPDNFFVAERFRHGLTDEEIHKGIEAFREFLYALFDELAINKDKIDVETGKNYDPYGDNGPRGNGNIKYCFPIINDLAITLFSLGFHGKLETEPEKRLTVEREDMLKVICPVTEKYHSLIKMKLERKKEVFYFLSSLGICFNNTNFSKTGTFNITYDKNAFFIIGLKLIAEATMNNRDYIKIENLFGSAFFRCDFYPLANMVPKKHIKKIKEYANAQSPEIREWIIEIDTFLTNNDCTISNVLSDEFIYTKRKNKNRKGMVCKIYMGIMGCYITPGINHLENPDNILYLLPDSIMDLMKAKAERECGWCAYSRRNPDVIQCKQGCPFKFTHEGIEYLKCRYAEFKIPLDNVSHRKYVKKWLEMEITI